MAAEWIWCNKHSPPGTILPVCTLSLTGIGCAFSPGIRIFTAKLQFPTEHYFCAGGHDDARKPENSNRRQPSFGPSERALGILPHVPRISRKSFSQSLSKIVFTHKKNEPTRDLPPSSRPSLLPVQLVSSAGSRKEREGTAKPPDCMAVP